MTNEEAEQRGFADSEDMDADMTPTPPAEALLPCPFCGGNAEIITGPIADRFGVRCTSCGVWRDDRAKERLGAIYAWNTRAAQPVAVAPRIDTAPKDGTVVDLWENGERHADCYWGKTQHDCGEAGQHCDSDWHREKEGWVYSPLNHNMGETFKPTHWMPLPAAPESPR